MKNVPHSFPAALFVATALWAVPVPLLAAAGDTSGSSSTCTVTVYTTNDDGSTDNSVRPFQASCRSGQSNGDFEYYNPYTDTYETRSGLPRLEPLVIKKKSSSTSRTGTSTSQGGSRSTTGSSSSQSSAGSSGAPCTSSGTSSKAIKQTRSTASGRPCTSTPR